MLFNKKYSKEEMCGGSTTSYDAEAQKEIKSKDMILFKVSSRLEEDNLLSFSSFAVKTKNGSFVYLQKIKDRYSHEAESKLAYITKDIFPDLAELVIECNLAKNNGYHSNTHGLPENFGGSVYILYSSGEKISFSDNSSPIISNDTGRKICEFFEKVLKTKKVALPSLTELSELRIFEEHSGGGYTKANLLFNEDGSGTDVKESKYDSPTVYKKESVIDKETIEKIVNTIDNSLLFAWADLPKKQFSCGNEEYMTFVFKNGNEIVVRNDRELPYEVGNAFFNIKLELTTNH